MKCSKGVITASTTDAATSAVDLSAIFSATEPLRAIMVWCNANTTDGMVATSRMSVGFGSFDGAAIQQGGVAVFDLGDDVSATAEAWRAVNTTWILRNFTNATGTLDYEIDLTAFSDTGFTLTYTAAPASAIIIHYLAIGGSDVSAARVISAGLPVTTPQAITVVAGFGKPDLIFSLASAATALTDGQASTAACVIGLGVGKSDTERQASIFGVRDAQAAVSTALWQKQRFILDISAAAANKECDLDIVANWPTDGFQIVKPVAGLGDSTTIYLALKGTFQSAIGVDTALTAGSTDDIAAGFAPAGALLFGGNQAASATVFSSGATLGTWGIGATDGTNEGWSGWHSDDANTEATADAILSQTKAIVMYDAGESPVVQSEADASFAGNSLRLTWTDLDTVAREYVYLILGPPPGVTVPYRNPMPQLLAQ